MLKRFIVILFSILLLSCLLSACGKESKNEGADGLTIVATVFPQYDFACRITEGTDAKVSMLLGVGSEPHSYEPTPSDVVSINESDLFIWVGGESEAWAQKLLASTGKEREKVMALMDMVPLLETESGHGNEDNDHTDGEEHDHEHDEHVWTSPRNAIAIVNALAERICELDPSNSEIYLANAKAYITELTALDNDLTSLGEKADKPLIFGDRFPFLDLAHDYGFEYISPFRGCSSSTEASMAEIAEVITTARNTQASVIFSVDFSNEKLAATIADEVGAEVLRLYSCHMAGADDIKNGIGYIELMRKNLESLEEAIGN